ncbi:MAG: hypothetical protein CYPHOPRED_005355 [Cyphobasidiales sp. Tagirdzhanova-0007]|nr:MAG: hypothetical protein CYPHOPRED_005355 [Cyphobasidiales sp. Tagirdzhanova-0007]
MHASRSSRSTSIDLFVPESPKSLKDAFEKLSRRSKSVSGPASHGAALSNYESKLVWRDRNITITSGRWRTRRHLSIVLALLALSLLIYSTAHKSARHYLTRQSTSTSCNPYIVSGNFHADYSEPSNNYWEPIDAATCRAPQYVKQLRAGDYKGMEWMQNRTVVLLGDSIERDHVNLFCSILGKEAETIKGKHPLAVAAGISDSMESNERKKKDRASRIAFKGMQESTLPKLCYVKELNFMLVNMYHFGLDEQGYWQALDQFHGPGSIEERFETQFGPFISKLRSDYRASAPDLIEISSGMFDLAKWAKEDIAGEQNTEDELSADRLAWYESRVSRFMEVTTASFPAAIKVWRGVTHPEDQAAELDYFNDRFGHSPASSTPHFSTSRVHQIDQIARKLAHPSPPIYLTQQSFKARRSIINETVAVPVHQKREFVYNPWSSLIQGAPAHQLDRLHGGDLATPGAVLWSDMMLWHLKQGVGA